MDKKKIAKLVLYLLCVVSFIVFVVGLANRFSFIKKHGFDLTEYWAIVVFGLIFSFVAAMYSLVKAIAEITPVIRARRNAKDSADEWQNPVNPTLSAQNDGEVGVVDTVAEPLPEESESPVFVESGNDEAPAPVVVSCENATEKEAVSKPKRLSHRERKKQRILEDEGVLNQRINGMFGIFAVAVMTVFCIFYSVWSIFPNRLAFHNYSYNEAANGQAFDPNGDGIRNLRFYQDYLGRPYFIHVEGDREVEVELSSTTRGEDETGEYILYHFYTEKDYAKILDKLTDKITYLTVDMQVYYYVTDAHIVVTYTTHKKRLEVDTDVTLADGVIYSYKSLEQ